ncbi:hypothetical protein SUGI_0104200 [Cryptomeria japonica]|nr:hypothetical protein SUGI_0104200 [Cryptomeria japonica]
MSANWAPCPRVQELNERRKATSPHSKSRSVPFRQAVSILLHTEVKLRKVNIYAEGLSGCPSGILSLSIEPYTRPLFTWGYPSVEGSAYLVWK